MTIDKPFYKISRPFSNGNFLSNIDNTYLLDKRYANDRVSLIRAFHILSSDLMELFDFIEPCDNNKITYSHRIYELYLRAATEFESNCKSILKHNDYTTERNLNIRDYFKINKATRFDEYNVVLNIWSPEPLELKPFGEWNADEFHSLAWYQNYNLVKHDRNINFSQANIENLTNTVAAVFIVLFSQFNVFAFDPNQLVNSHMIDDDGFFSTESSIFKIKPPTSWNKNEKYDFDWNSIKISSNSINKYVF